MMVFATDEVDVPRPWPMMVFKNLEKLKVMPVHSVVKVTHFSLPLPLIARVVIHSDPSYQ
jgi:hypothetical protein